MQNQLSGYGTRPRQVQEVVDLLEKSNPNDSSRSTSTNKNKNNEDDDDDDESKSKSKSNSSSSGSGSGSGNFGTTISGADVHDLSKWEEKDVERMVRVFREVRFPTIYVLNKVDTPAADANILRICEKYGEVRLIIFYVYIWNAFVILYN